MNHIRGSAVKLKSEIRAEDVSGSTMTVTVNDPNGTAVLTDSAMAFDTVNTNIAFKVWQSAITSVVGRYTYYPKVTNGANVNIAKGFFNLEEE